MSFELTKEWLKAAYGDIAVLNKIADDEFLTHMTAFHSQQCIEKSLKSLLIANNINFKRIHSLNKLSSLCDSFVNFDDNFDLIQLLDSLYTESRYPGEIGLLPSGKPTLEQAQEFYEFSTIVFNKTCIILEIDPEEVKK